MLTVKRWLNRYKALKHFRFEGKGADVLFHKDVWFYLSKGSKVILREGLVVLGYDFPGRPHRPSYDKTVVTLKENATLSLGSGVHICPGTSIYVGKEATMVLEGENWIGNNCTFICTNRLVLGRNTSLSWNVTLIDDDGRTFYKENGEPILSTRRPLMISENVGLQMNVVIPKGVHIGKNAVVGANTVVRRDIPDNCLAYQNPEMKLRNDTTVGLQYAG